MSAVSPPSDEWRAPLDGAESSSEQRAESAPLSPFRVALRRLRRNKLAVVSGGFALAIGIACCCAPLYSSLVAHVGPNDANPLATVTVGGHLRSVLSASGIPIGPTWHARYFLGADPDGRDEAVRLLYGGRTSLEVGLLAATLTMLLATVLGTVAGYLRGVTDTVLARLFDVIWSYPVIILGVALGTTLALGGLRLGPVVIGGSSLAIPILVIGFAFMPYIARPIRGQVLALRELEFVDAARAYGAGPVRIMITEIVPNLSSTIVAFFPLVIANAILFEAGLSYLGAGVQPPNASWGTMIAQGVQLIPAAAHVTLIPGLMLFFTVLAINLFGDGVREAFDPHGAVGLAAKK